MHCQRRGCATSRPVWTSIYANPSTPNRWNVSGVPSTIGLSLPFDFDDYAAFR